MSETEISPVSPTNHAAPHRDVLIPTSVQTAKWDYAPAPESVKVEIKPQYGHFIIGGVDSCK